MDVMVNVPLYPVFATFAIVTVWPTEKPCAARVLIVTRLPASVAPVALAPMPAARNGFTVMGSVFAARLLTKVRAKVVDVGIETTTFGLPFVVPTVGRAFSADCMAAATDG